MTPSLKPRSDTRKPPLTMLRDPGAPRSFTPPCWGCGAPGEDTQLLPAPGSKDTTRQGTTGPSFRTRLARGWGRFLWLWFWLEDSWVGDLIGAVSLFATFYLLLVFGWAISE